MLSAWAAPTTPPPMQLYMQGVLLLLLLARSASPASLVGTATCHCRASQITGYNQAGIVLQGLAWERSRQGGSKPALQSAVSVGHSRCNAAYVCLPG